MSSKVLFVSYCTNKYDHDQDVTRDLVYYNGSIYDDENSDKRGEYVSWAEDRIKGNKVGWVSLIELDCFTGESTVLYVAKNPLQQRTELNVKAKEMPVKKSSLASAYVSLMATQAQAASAQGLNPASATANWTFTDDPISINSTPTTNA